MKVLSFGHIPTWAGGRQSSGLANVIYQLAKHGSEIADAQVVLAATDCFIPRRMDGKLLILGWTKSMLARYVLLHPAKSIRSLVKLIGIKRKYPRNTSFWGVFLKRIFFEKTVRDIAPQIVHLHGASAIWYQDLVPSTCKLSVTFHGMTGLDKNLPQHEILYQIEHDVFHSQRVDGVFFICTELIDYFIKAYGCNGKNNQVIFNSYDKNHFYYDKNDCSRDSKRTGKLTTLCTIASLSDLKGQVRVMEGIASLLKPDRFRYFCIGGGDEKYANMLDEYAKEHNINYHYLGKMPPQDIRTHLYEADYMIMPSSSEGFGLTYLEAIACGVPVILPPNIPIAKEKNLINKNNSILLEDCSSKSIAGVLSHIEDYTFVKERVAESIAGFSWDEIALLYIKAYKSMLA